MRKNDSINRVNDVHSRVLFNKMVEGEIMDKHELYAIGHYLSEWPEDMTYSQVLAEMATGDKGNKITESEDYENTPLEDLAALIDGMTESLRNYFK